MNDINDPTQTPPAMATPEAPARPELAPVGMIRQFYNDLVMNLTEPRRFYIERYPQMTLNYALAFALVVSWIAAFLKWMVRILNHETFFDGFLRIRDQLMQLPVWRDLPTSIWAQNPAASASIFPNWIAEAAGVALFPFSFLLNLVIQAVALTVGGFIFLSNQGPTSADGNARDRQDITHFIKIVALSSTPSIVGAILSFLPLGLGAFVGTIYSLFLLLLAISIRYRVSGLRSFAIVVAPWLLLVMVGSCIIGIFGAMLFGFIASIFSLN